MGKGNNMYHIDMRLLKYELQLRDLLCDIPCSSVQNIPTSSSTGELPSLRIRSETSLLGVGTLGSRTRADEIA